jgi:hypothetical protein
LHELPPLDEDDILPAENDNNVPVIGAFDTDADDTTEQSQFVYVQDPSTKKVSRQRNDMLLKDQAREGQRRQRDDAQRDGLGDGRKVLEQTARAVSVVFMLGHSLLAGMAVVMLVMVYVPNDFLAYYSRLANTCRSISVFLVSVCILGAFDKHRQDAARGWDSDNGASYGRSLCIIVLYCISFLLTLVNTPMDDTMSWAEDRVPLWYTYAKPSSDFDTRLTVWKALNTVRLIFAILAWLLLASDSRTQPMVALIDYEYEYRRAHVQAIVQPVQRTAQPRT